VMPVRWARASIAFLTAAAIAAFVNSRQQERPAVAYRAVRRPLRFGEPVWRCGRLRGDSSVSRLAPAGEASFPRQTAECQEPFNQRGAVHVVALYILAMRVRRPFQPLDKSVQKRPAEAAPSE
jgi:hypothetical protein